LLLCQSYLTWHSFEFRAMAIFCCYGRFNLLNKILTFMMISVDVKQPLVHQARVKRIKGSSLSISPPLPKRHVTQRANGSCWELCRWMVPVMSACGAVELSVFWVDKLGPCLELELGSCGIDLIHVLFGWCKMSVNQSVSYFICSICHRYRTHVSSFLACLFRFLCCFWSYGYVQCCCDWLRIQSMRWPIKWWARHYTLLFHYCSCCCCCCCC